MVDIDFERRILTFGVDETMREVVMASRELFEINNRYDDVSFPFIETDAGVVFLNTWKFIAKV